MILQFRLVSVSAESYGQFSVSVSVSGLNQKGGFGRTLNFIEMTSNMISIVALGSSVRPKPPFWFRPNTKTETENWP